MLPFNHIYLPSKQALAFKTSTVFPDSMDESSIHHYIIGLCKPKKWTLHFTVEFTSSFLRITLCRTCSEKTKGVCIYEASLRVQHSCCNIFLTGSNLQVLFIYQISIYLIRHIKVNRIIRMDLWTKIYLPCLPGYVYIKT